MKNNSLDAIDIRILSALQQHGQLSKSRLAELVNLSPTPCWNRLNRLKNFGFIQGYRADLAFEKIADFSQVVVTISLDSHRKSDFERFESYIGKLDEVVECIATGGGMDYVLRVFTRNLQLFQSLMDNMLADDLGIDRYFTYIVTRNIKSSSPNLIVLTKASD